MAAVFRGKELVVFMLDVGPSMHPHLEHAGRALFTFVEGKVRDRGHFRRRSAWSLAPPAA
jgi:hypothetical protein